MVRSISGEILVHFHTNEPLLAGKWWGMEDLNFQGVIIPIQNDLYKWGDMLIVKCGSCHIHKYYYVIAFN